MKWIILALGWVFLLAGWATDTLDYLIMAFIIFIICVIISIKDK